MLFMNPTFHRRTLLRAGVTGAFALSLALVGCKQPDAPTDANGVASNGTAANGADVSAVGSAKPYPADAKTIVLGEYGSLTGGQATFGISTDNAIKMAVAEINAKGGVLGKPVEVLVEDDSSKAEQVPGAVLKLINENNVLAILGEVASSNSLKAAPICQAAGVPMLSPTSTNPKVTQIGDYIFRACFVDPYVGEALAQFARVKLNAQTAAIFTDVKSDYSKGLSQYFKDAFVKAGGKVVAQESFRGGEDTNFRPQLTNFKGKNPDVIYVPGYYTEVGNIAVQARSVGLIKQILLGSDGWDSPELFKIGGRALDGSYFTNHYSPASRDPKVVKFVGDYTKKYGQEPDALAAVAYDAAYMMFDAIKRAGTLDRAKLRDALAATKNFPGVTGNITMDANRNAQKPLVFIKIQGGKTEVVEGVKP